MELKLSLSDLAFVKVIFGCTPWEDTDAWKILFDTVNIALEDGNKRRVEMIDFYVKKDKDAEGNNIAAVKDVTLLPEFEKKMAEFHVVLNFPEDKFKVIQQVWNEFPTRFIHPKTGLAGILGEQDLAVYNRVKEIFNPSSPVNYD